MCWGSSRFHFKSSASAYPYFILFEQFSARFQRPWRLASTPNFLSWRNILVLRGRGSFWPKESLPLELELETEVNYWKHLNFCARARSFVASQRSLHGGPFSLAIQTWYVKSGKDCSATRPFFQSLKEEKNLKGMSLNFRVEPDGRIILKLPLGLTIALNEETFVGKTNTLGNLLKVSKQIMDDCLGEM